MNSKALTAVKALVLGGFFPAQEVFSHYPFQNQSDAIVASPRYVIGFIDSATAATFAEGMFVSHTGAVVDADYGDAATFDKTVAGQRPVGRVEKMSGTYLLIRTLDLQSDIEIAGATAGTEYVVGTDGLLAKSGDSTYPLTVVNPVVVGKGYIAGRIMLGLGGDTLVSSSQGSISGYSSAILANTLTAFSKNVPFNASRLRVGQQIVTRFMIDVSAAVVNTTISLGLFLDAATVFSSTNLLDPLYTGDVVSGEIITECRVAGASGKFISWGHVGCKGEAADKRIIFGGVASETSIDFSATAMVAQLKLGFSAAGANSAILRSQRTFIQ